MKLYPWFAILLLCFSVSAFCGDEADKKPAPPPPPAEIKFWRFEADIDSRRSAIVSQGESIDQVIAKLGNPRKRWKKKKDPINQELSYLRKVRGPMGQRNVITRDGSTTVRYQVTYMDEITLFFRSEKLHEVKTHRVRSDDAHEGLPAFMQ